MKEAPDSISKAFRDARLGLQLSMRDVEDLTAIMARERPDLYDSVVRNTVSKLERHGSVILNVTGHRVLRALIVLLFQSVEAFVAVTGVDLHLSSAQHSSSRLVPLWDEGQVVDANLLTQASAASKTVACPVVTSSYAVRVTTHEHAPLLVPDQLVYVRPSVTAEIGDLIVVQRPDRLALAYAVADDCWITTQDGRLFRPKRGDKMRGRVEAVSPSFPRELLISGEEVIRATG